tara:strand:+ start:720 stop:890 length:171 start_codon:yes stop_codon:yes gene_type:complete
MKKCRHCKIELTPIDLKEIKRLTGRGYLCEPCYKKQTKKYNDKRKGALKEWRRMYG